MQAAASSRWSVVVVGVVALALAAHPAQQHEEDAKPAQGEKARVERPASKGENAPAKPAQTTADSALPPSRSAKNQRMEQTGVRPSGPPPEFRGPDITLIAGEERTVYEYRQNGQLRMIKVVPRFGKPYYLAPRDPTSGWGDLEQADSLIAQWVLWEF